LKNFKILNFFHFEKKTFAKNKTLFYLLSFSKKELVSKVWVLWTHDQQFSKIKGLIFTHNCRSQKNQKNWSNNLAPKALVVLPFLP
jgi:hypothetical protein